ncbi:hypothetical protein [Streptomyces sp. SID12501]|uniref:Uncharacterized protein n=1 Tax=Streptomyces sp. SID12501 TaxID=2706042 RepID=A0A6B3C019_9ACTN|nr:hypothetical protein [Streptomyces sp. SID12501]NEC89816.1 hypothetical protein [Streptomyces sp. SID12501]
MGRQFKDMQTPEQQYAAGRAGDLRQQADVLSGQARQMSGRIGRTAYSNRGQRQRAVDAVRETATRADALREQADTMDPAPKKRRWFR